MEVRRTKSLMNVKKQSAYQAKGTQNLEILQAMGAAEMKKATSFREKELMRKTWLLFCQTCCKDKLLHYYLSIWGGNIRELQQYCLKKYMKTKNKKNG